jgi:hypothetical protein
MLVELVGRCWLLKPETLDLSPPALSTMR